MDVSSGSGLLKDDHDTEAVKVLAELTVTVVVDDGIDRQEQAVDSWAVAIDLSCDGRRIDVFRASRASTLPRFNFDGGLL